MLRRLGDRVRRLLGTGGQGTDLARWSDPRSLARGWDERTRLLARFIPEGSRVIDFGAGNMALRRYLPARCTYTPCDLVSRGAGCIVCDLNAPSLPDLRGFDAGFFSGVLEYVRDLPRLLAHLSPRVVHVIASYAPADRGLGRLRLVRSSRGWANHFTARELPELFVTAGYELRERGEWRGQILYRFTQRSSVAEPGSPGMSR